MNADDLLAKKAQMEHEQKQLEENGRQEDGILQKKLKTIGNHVHDSVPVSNNEVKPFQTALSLNAEMWKG